MKKILKITSVFALMAIISAAFVVVNTQNLNAQTTATTSEEPKRDLDSLTAAEKAEIEAVLGKKINDLSDEERERLENLTDEEMAEMADMAASEAQDKILDRESEILDAAENSDLSDSDRATLEDYRQQAEEAGDYATRGSVPADLYKDHDIEELAFAKGKRGCAMKSSFFFAVARQYESGASLESLSSFKIMAPLFEKIITEIETKGVEQANIDNLKQYNACVASYAEEEGVRSAALDPCAELNTIVIDTLESIEKRQSVGTVISRHERTDLDLSETSYKNLEDPVPLFIGKLYEAAAKGGKKNAVATASTITVGCVN